MSRWKLNRALLPPLVLALCLFGVYLRTLAPGLTWANGGSDGGDLITAAYTGGIAHPSGYPLYLLLARLFQSLPLGSLAFRTNLMSAAFTALGAALVYRLVERALPDSKGDLRWLAGLGAGCAFGLAPLVWSQAVITEVYALQALLVVLILSLFAGPAPAAAAAHPERLDRWRGAVLGLAMGNHLTTVLLVPAALLLACVKERAAPEGHSRSEGHWPGYPSLDAASLRRQLAWCGAGLCLYLLIPLRAFAHPPVNWGNPVTLGRLWWLVSGGTYSSYFLQTSLPELLERIRPSAALLLAQFGLPGLVLGLTGLVVFWVPSRLYLLTTWTALASLAFALLYASADFYVYLIPVVLSFAIWVGLGIAGLVRQVSGRFPSLGLGLGLILVGVVAGRSVAQWSEVDASRDSRAETFRREVLSAAPEHAILFAQGDQALFALWYTHFALEQRPDLAVVAPDLLHFDWYQETLRSTYPGLNLPGPLPWPGTLARANPARPACYVQYIDRTEIECTQTVTTP